MKMSFIYVHLVKHYEYQLSCHRKGHQKKSVSHTIHYNDVTSRVGTYTLPTLCQVLSKPFPSTVRPDKSSRDGLVCHLCVIDHRQQHKRTSELFSGKDNTLMYNDIHVKLKSFKGKWSFFSFMF